MKKNLLIDIDAIVKSIAPFIPHDNAISLISRIVHDLGYSVTIRSSENDRAGIIPILESIFRSEQVIISPHVESKQAAGDIWIHTGENIEAGFNGNVIAFDNWPTVYETLKNSSRKISHQRNTKETQISIDLNLDGQGVADISTGLHFFDHMLEQIARHGGIDIRIIAKGDLHIDEHHTIEDTAITLGEAFALGLGDKRGIERYGFCLPMDDALAQVALDFGGRSWLVWDADFKREKIGDVPTEMFYHFFKSFCDGAKCNLNIRVEGDNEHHKIESIFKAFAKSIKMAVKRDLDNMQLPSTKGIL